MIGSGIVGWAIVQLDDINIVEEFFLVGFLFFCFIFSQAEPVCMLCVTVLLWAVLLCH